MKLIRRFIEIMQNRGLREALESTNKFLRYKIPRNAKLYLMRKRYGDSVVKEINASLMELDITSNSPNKLERTLALNGIRERGATHTYRNVLNKLNDQYSGIHVFDIGANVGYFALMAAGTLEDNGQVYAIEAEPDNADRLRYNIDINGYQNITVKQIAAGSERSQLELSLRSSSNVHRMTEILEDKEAVESVDVEVYPIDELVREYNLPANELIIIRMDVEGYEAHVLDGMKQLFVSDRPMYLFAEIHPSVKRVNPDEIADLLKEHGFTADYISDDGGDTYRHMDSIDEIRELDSNGHIMVGRIN